MQIWNRRAQNTGGKAQTAFITIWSLHQRNTPAFTYSHIPDFSPLPVSIGDTACDRCGAKLGEGTVPVAVRAILSFCLLFFYDATIPPVVKPILVLKSLVPVVIFSIITTLSIQQVLNTLLLMLAVCWHNKNLNPLCVTVNVLTHLRTH